MARGTSQIQSPATELPEVQIVAINLDGCWQMELEWCSPEDLSQRLERKGISCEQFRLVGGQYRANPPFSSWLLAEAAGRAGWFYDQVQDCWFAMDETLDLVLPSVPQGEMKLELDSITYGWLRWWIRSDTQEVRCHADEMDAPIVPFVRFWQLLEEGKYPHIQMEHREWTQLICLPAEHSAPDMVRVCLVEQGRETKVLVDTVQPREAFMRELRVFFETLSEHKGLGHQFLCYSALPDQEFCALDDAAEAEWDRGVQAGIYPADSSGREEFTANAVTEGIQLSEDDNEYVNKYRQMLKSREIPEKWQRSHFLV